MRPESPPNLHVFETKEQLLASAAAAIGAAAAQAIAARGTFTLALTGGSVARSLYPVLARTDGLVDWARTRFFWGDERCVPPTDEESNFRLAKETLLDRAPIPAENVHRMRADDPDLEWASHDYAKILPEKLDLILLGVGPDGHVCSLFPGFPQLDERERLVVPVEGSPKPPARRLTITPPVIAAARQTLAIAMSADKAAAVKRALAAGGSPRETPARLARGGMWLLTRDAAA